MEQNQPNAGAPNASGSAGKLDEIAARVVANGTPSSGDDGIIGEQAEQQKLTVDVGGVQRTVTMEELTAAFNDREQTLATRKTLDERLAELGDLNSVKRLNQQIGTLDHKSRAKVMAILSGQGDDDDDDSMEDAVRQELRRQPGAQDEEDGDEPRGVPRDFAKKFDYLQEVVMALAKRENTRVVTETKATLQSRVETEMSQYPLFQQDPVAASLAKDSIMAMLAADQSAEPDKVVRSAAGRLQELLTQRQQDAAASLGVPRTMVQPQERKGLNAEGLRTGVVRKLAERLLSGSGP